MGTLYSVNKTDGVVTAGGAKLPTTGGTASTLDYYEESTHSMDFESDIFGATNFTLVFRIVRIGKLVSLTFDTVFGTMALGTGNDSITSKATFELPTRFRPSSYPARLSMVGHNNGSNLSVAMRVEANGAMGFGSGDFYTTPFIFNAGSQTGLSGHTISYIVT